MQVTLLQKIRLLPQVIQDLISEYNVDHRTQMRALEKEYFTVIYKNCIFCSAPPSKELYMPVDYFLCKKYNLHCFWCSEDCFYEDVRNDMKQNYLESIHDYMKKHTIQFASANQSIELE